MKNIILKEIKKELISYLIFFSISDFELKYLFSHKNNKNYFTLFSSIKDNKNLQCKLLFVDI